MDGNSNEWAVAYHGTKTIAVKPIYEVNGKFFSINCSFYFLFLQNLNYINFYDINIIQIIFS